MDKKWFSATELLLHPLLPGTTQGIHKKAKRDGWISRKKQGVQGKAIEYSLYSFSDDIRDYICNQSDFRQQSVAEEPFSIWMNAFKQLSPNERRTITKYILREGIISIYKLL